MLPIGNFEVGLFVVIASVVAFAIGFAITFALKTCQEKKHVLFYLVVLLSIVYLGYMLFLDEDILLLRMYAPVLYFGFLLLIALYALFFYAVYKWSLLSYVVMAIIALFAGLLFSAELNIVSELMAQSGASPYEINDFASSFSNMAVYGMFGDFIKFGLLLGAKYKFLK
ncbi:MAG: hypothetical protein WC350_05610 [Candidatus Micrarchaeia archaeon]|jgi:hypothetical protein